MLARFSGGKTVNSVNEYRRYWRFFWPLALNGVFLLVGLQAFNGVLARHADPARELAVYSYAIGIFFFFDIGAGFLPQLVTVFARSAAARARVLRFCLAVGVLFSLPVLLAGGTAPGRSLVAALYDLDASMAADVSAYLRLLGGVVVLHVLHHYLNGVLIQAERTAWVSGIGIAGVGISIATAVHGFRNGWSPVLIVSGAEWASALFKLTALLLVWRVVRRFASDDGSALPAWGELLRFFWPVCISGMTFGLSRPLLFIFISRAPAAVAIIAAMRVSMDFLMLFQAVVNQFRHFFAAFGLDALALKRRFMGIVALVLTCMMGAVLLTPLSRLFFVGALGLEPELYESARWMGIVLLVVPGILMMRNYYHGILIVRRRTAAMALGSLARVLGIAGSGAALLAAGWLDQRTAVLAMIAGFVAEMLVAWLSVRRIGNHERRELAR